VALHDLGEYYIAEWVSLRIDPVVNPWPDRYLQWMNAKAASVSRVPVNQLTITWRRHKAVAGARLSGEQLVFRSQASEPWPRLPDFSEVILNFTGVSDISDKRLPTRFSGFPERAPGHQAGGRPGK
jgi:hypothetical protein